MARRPLENGSTIVMAENGGTYTVRYLIGKGGYSLVYAADVPGGTTSVAIKEFFPSEGANRGADGKVCSVPGFEESFQRKLARFENEGEIGGRLSEISFQTIPFVMCGNGYAMMKRESADMCSIADLVARWAKSEPVPFTGNAADCDPVFPDLVRLRYALRITESVLAVVSRIHAAGFLHLDISHNNVIWAGHGMETGETCNAFLADFGSSVKTTSGTYRLQQELPPTSGGFAAPETQRKGALLSPATDLFSVGVLLFYLCIGRNALESTCNRENQLEREMRWLRLPERMLGRLQSIILRATESDSTKRYQTAEAMLEVVHSLRIEIPDHPINPDNTTAFTLFSLKSMLEGSLGKHYSWAEELKDRRHMYSVDIPKIAYAGISDKVFQDDMYYLKAVLPEELYEYLDEKIGKAANQNHTLYSILSGNYDFTWKREICQIIKKRKTRRLLEFSRTLLSDEAAFLTDQRLLIKLLGKDGERLRACFQSRDIRTAPYIGLAMIIVFALLGPAGFKLLLPSPTNMGDLFQPL